jgi:hypothetical protein
MPGLVPGIHVLWQRQQKDVDGRDEPGHDGETTGSNSALYFAPGSEITWLATSLFQMNSTSSAPIVAVMKPAPWSGP